VPAILRAVSDQGPTRVLLTGAGGYLGSQAIAPLLAAGYEVHGVGRQPGGPGSIPWHAVDLLDERATRALVHEIGATHLLHLAWFTAHGAFWSASENLDWVGASLRLLRAFVDAGGRRAVVAGTCAEYDWRMTDAGCREIDRNGRAASPTNPATLYGVAKHSTHAVARAFAAEAGFSLAWGRIFLLYGLGEDERRLVPQVALRLLRGAPAPTSDGRQVRDFMHVCDVAAGFVALLDSDVEGPVNIASGEGIPMAEVISMIGVSTGRPDLLRIGELSRREGEPDRLVADVGRLREEVGFQPTIGLADGIAETVAWWRTRLGT
jgi:nucleoside-diphosphate-sugar epimerase